MRAFGDWVAANSTVSATSSASRKPDSSTLSLVRPLPSANSVLTPAGQMTPTLMPNGCSSMRRALVKPTWACLVAQ